MAGAIFALGLGASALLRLLPRGAIPVGPTLAAAPTSQPTSAALLNGGFSRGYDGGHRGSWCG